MGGSVAGRHPRRCSDGAGCGGRRRAQGPPFPRRLGGSRSRPDPVRPRHDSARSVPCKWLAQRADTTGASRPEARARRASSRCVAFHEELRQVALRWKLHPRVPRPHAGCNVDCGIPAGPCRDAVGGPPEPPVTRPRGDSLAPRWRSRRTRHPPGVERPRRVSVAGSLFPIRTSRRSRRGTSPALVDTRPEGNLFFARHRLRRLRPGAATGDRCTGMNRASKPHRGSPVPASEPVVRAVRDGALMAISALLPHEPG